MTETHRESLSGPIATEWRLGHDSRCPKFDFNLSNQLSAQILQCAINNELVFRGENSVRKCISLISATVLLQLLMPTISFADESYDLDIQGQDVPAALQDFATQTGLQVVYFTAVTDDAAPTQSLEGRYSAEEALDRLLEGSDLTYTSVDAETYSIAKKDATEVAEKPEGKWRPASQDQSLMAQNTTSDQALTNSRNSSTNNSSDTVETPYDEIIVTSQIREENFQNVPVTGTVFNSAALEANRLVEITDVARFVPGFSASSFNNSSPNYSVRGAMNTFSQAGVSKPVGIFVDDVYIPRYSAAAFELFDVRQMAVLRGPQGTLFGRNVTGGAIQVYTTEPSLDQTVIKLRAGVGNYSFSELSAFVSIPFTNEFAGKLSVSKKKRNGFSVDRFNGRDVEDQDAINVRGSLLYVPSDNVTMKVSADYATDQNGSKGYSFVSSLDGLDLTGNDGNIRTTELRVPQSYDRDIFGVSAHIDVSLNSGDFQSITAYRRSKSRELYSLGAADVTLPSVSVQFIKDDNDAPTSFSQEFRYISEQSERFDFVAGAFFYLERNDRFLGDTLLGANGNAVFVSRDFTVEAKTHSLAAYFNGTVHLGPNFDLGFGGRYTKEEKDVSVIFIDNNNAGNSFTTAPGNDFNEFTPRVTLSYYATDAITLFASRTEGFTAGGFNTETNNQGSVESGFAPETITATELGIKSSWNDGNLIVNLTVFDQEYEDKQEGFLLPGNIFSILNASKASMTGAELELAWSISDSFRTTIAYSRLDAKYDSFVLPDDDFSGNKLQTAPESTYSIALDYGSDLGSGYLDAGVSYTWQDDYFTGASNIPDFFIDSYGLLNARIGYEWGGGRWAAKLWGKNLGDEDFVQIRGTVGAIAEYYGAPRTYGLNVTYSTE